MRPSSLLLALLLTACTEADNDKPGKSAAQVDKAPAAAERELDTDGELDKRGRAVDQSELERAKCVAACVEANVTEAKPADVIEADCQSKCDQQGEQVEERPQ